MKLVCFFFKIKKLSKLKRRSIQFFPFWAPGNLLLRLKSKFRLAIARAQQSGLNWIMLDH